MSAALEMLPEPAPVIRISDFSLWYGTFQALHKVDALVSHRRVTSLIGPSGCGKSTLLRSMNRMNDRVADVRTEGQIAILGKSIHDPDVSVASLRKVVGMVFQRPNPLPISIYDNVVFGLRTHLPRSELGRDLLDAAVESALSQVELWASVKDRLNDKATLLSLEEQQKLCIARLLPLKPEIMLMDEPCSALDATGTARIETLIKGLREQFTIVIVTHSMGQAKRVSDDCMFLMMGKLVEHQATELMFSAPKDERTAMYVEGRYG